MASIGEKELKQQIKAREFSNAYLIYGEESYLKQHYVNTLIKKIVGDSPAVFNLHRFEGKDVSLPEIIETADSLPMMAEYICIVVRDFDLKGMKTADKELFTSFMEELPESCIVIFWMDSVEVPAKLTKGWKSIVDLFSKHASAVCLNRRTNKELSKLLISGASKRKCTLPLPVANYLLTLVGDDLNILLNELEKVCFYAGEREITKADVDAVAIKSVDATAFDMVKALIRNQYEKAYQMLDILFQQKAEPVLILGALISSYVDMYRVKTASTAGVSPEAVAKYFQYRNREFRLRYAAQDASKLSVAQLRRCLDILAEADRMLKSSRSDSRFILEKAMMQLLLASNEESV